MFAYNLFKLLCLNLLLRKYLMHLFLYLSWLPWQGHIQFGYFIIVIIIIICIFNLQYALIDGDYVSVTVRLGWLIK